MSSGKHSVYLAGSMEFAADKGIGWRDEVQAKLVDKGLEVHNPARSESVVLKNHGITSIPEFHNLKHTDYERFKTVMRDTIQYDLTEIAMSDSILLYIDKTLCNRASGTIGEVTAAFYFLRVPVFAVVAPDVDLAHVSGWLLACTHSVYNSFDEAIKAIEIKSKEGY